MTKEAKRYFNNAKEILKKTPIEDNRYADVKYVREACGTAYLAVLKAIDDYISERGVTQRELPRSIDAYRAALRKYGGVRNGKLSKEFEDIYAELHIAGYYRGDLRSVKVVKGALETAKSFMEKLST